MQLTTATGGRLSLVKRAASQPQLPNFYSSYTGCLPFTNIHTCPTHRLIFYHLEPTLEWTILFHNFRFQKSIFCDCTAQCQWIGIGQSFLWKPGIELPGQRDSTTAVAEKSRVAMHYFILWRCALAATDISMLCQFIFWLESELSKSLVLTQ